MDLFGTDIPIPDKVKLAHLSPYQRFKLANNYRKATGSDRCCHCGSFIRCEYHDRQYFKCRQMGCSHGSATDIRRSYICNRFVKNLPE
jgi:hypothetical protein